MPDKNYCPRCELFKTITPEQIEKYAASYKLPENETASPQVVTKRLKRCAECRYLQNDMLCIQCGMFVVFRAKRKKAVCPDPDGNRW